MNLCRGRVALFVCLSVSACGSKTANPAAPPPPVETPAAATRTLQSIILGPTGAPPRFWAPGATNQTIAMGRFSDGATENVTSSCTDWQSDNTFVLTIDNGGLLTAHNSGSATITTTCQGVFARGLVPLNVMPTTLWTRSGTGSVQVVEVPLYVTRLRITGRSNGRNTTRLAVLADGLLLFEHTLTPNAPYDATHNVRSVPRTPPSPFISVQVYDSTNTGSWTLTEVR